MRQNYPAYKIESVPDVYTGITKLSLGAVDVMIVDMAEASYCIEAEEITNLTVAGRTQYLDRISIGVRKDWPEFVKILNKAPGQLLTGDILLYLRVSMETIMHPLRLHVLPLQVVTIRYRSEQLRILTTQQVFGLLHIRPDQELLR